MPDDNVMYVNEYAGDPPSKPADLKATRNAAAANTGRDRPKLSILPYNGQVHAAGAVTYGADKYARGNYFGPPPAKVDPVDRFLEYLDAAQRHIGKIAQAINVAKGTGGDQRAACALPDDEASGGFPASNLPHIAHAIAGLMIAVECGITDGLLPVDPGQPWKRDPMYAEVLARRGAAPTALAQKDDPDAERRRVAAANPIDKVFSAFDRTVCGGSISPFGAAGITNVLAVSKIGKIGESFVRGADATEPCPHIAHERPDLGSCPYTDCESGSIPAEPPDVAVQPLPFKTNDTVYVARGPQAGFQGRVTVVSDITGLITIRTQAGLSLRTSALNLEKVESEP